MSTISENLLALQQAKSDIKTAIEGKGQDLTDVPFTEYANKINDIQAGGSTGGEYFVKVIDYDGTLLAPEVRLNTGDTFELPEPPSHDGLVFQEWSCSQEIVNNKITITDNNVMVGAVYTTESGLNEFDIELTRKTGLQINLRLDGTKDWGDGSSDTSTSHTYADYGKYTIKCDGTSMSSSSSSTNLFGNTAQAQNYYCKRIRLSSSVRVGEGAFMNCYSLTSITIPHNTTRIGTAAFRGCYIKYVVLPSSVTAISNSAFSQSRFLIGAVIPHTVTSMGNSVFDECWNLRYIAIPDTITTIENGTCYRCYNLESIVIPNGVTTIGNYAFYSCYSLSNISLPNALTTLGTQCLYGYNGLTHISMPSSLTTIGQNITSLCPLLVTIDFSSHTSIPTLESSSSLIMNTSGKIIVPDNLYDEWIVATNWSSMADYIYKASEVK